MKQVIRKITFKSFYVIRKKVYMDQQQLHSAGLYVWNSIPDHIKKLADFCLLSHELEIRQQNQPCRIESMLTKY